MRRTAKLFKCVGDGLITQLLLKGCAIVGVYWGEFTRREPQMFAESIRQLGRWYAEGKLKPHISATFPLERAADALTKMANREVTGKVVLRVG